MPTEMFYWMFCVRFLVTLWVTSNEVPHTKIGYNAPALVQAAKSEEWITALVNRPSLGVEPSMNWPKILNESIMAVSPPGLHQVFTAMCGSCANECAYKVTLNHFIVNSFQGCVYVAPKPRKRRKDLH